MFFLYFYLGQSYAFKCKINSIAKSHFFKSYGFEVNGEYNVSLDNLYDCTNFLFGLLTREESIKVNNMFAHIDDIDCKDIKKEIGISFEYTVDKNKSNFSGKLDKKGIYTPIIMLCNAKSSNYKILMEFKNPNTYLDYRKIPLLILKPIITLMFCILLILWVINWTRNFTLKNLLHLFLTITFGVSFFYMLFYWLNLKHLDKTDKDTVLVHFVMIFDVLHKFFLLMAMMLAANGWCIIFEKLETKVFITSGLFSILAVIPYSILDLEYSSVIYEFMLILTGFIFFIIYYKNLIQAIDQANSYVLAHLYFISQSGIDPETTPIYGKYKLFNSISKVILMYFLFILFKRLISEIFLIPFWIGAFSYDLITFILMSSAAWIFRLKKQSKNGYMLIDTDDQDITKFALEDLDGVSIDSELLHKGAKWEEGMTLPPQPIIINKNSGNNDNNDEQNTKLNNENKDTNESHL